MTIPPNWIDLVFGGVRGFVFACFATLFLAAWGVQTWRLDTSQEKVSATLIEVGRWKEINATNYTSLQRVLRINKEWYEGSKLTRERQLLAINEAEQRGARLEKARKAAAQNRDKLYEENVHVQEWGSTVVPADLYDSLRGDWWRYQDGSR